MWVAQSGVRGAAFAEVTLGLRQHRRPAARRLPRGRDQAPGRARRRERLFHERQPGAPAGPASTCSSSIGPDLDSYAIIDQHDIEHIVVCSAAERTPLAGRGRPVRGVKQRRAGGRFPAVARELAAEPAATRGCSRSEIQPRLEVVRAQAAAAREGAEAAARLDLLRGSIVWEEWREARDAQRRASATGAIPGAKAGRGSRAGEGGRGRVPGGTRRGAGGAGPAPRPPAQAWEPPTPGLGGRPLAPARRARAPAGGRAGRRAARPGGGGAPRRREQPHQISRRGSPKDPAGRGVRAGEGRPGGGARGTSPSARPRSGRRAASPARG